MGGINPQSTWIKEVMQPQGFANLLPQLLPIPGAGLLARSLGFDELDSLYAAAKGTPFVDRVLALLNVECVAAPRDLEHLPVTGAAILTANHPTGILDGAVLAQVLLRVRSDVRFLANGLMAAVPEIRDLLIEVDPISSSAARANSRGLRRALAHLRAGGLLVVFPAGEVSSIDLSTRTVRDAEWNPAVARLASLAEVPVIPAYLTGGNSKLFHFAGFIHPTLRTALLGREFLKQRGAKVEVRIGSAIPAEKLRAMADDAERTEYLRWRTDLLAERERFHPQTRVPMRRGGTTEQPSAAPVAAELLAADVDALTPLDRAGELAAYLATAPQIPNVLPEIARLREVTFRAAGEGTGKAADLDRFDAHYLHLFVWHTRKREIVGAYRIAATDQVCRNALYTATLFHYEQAFLDKLGPALELGRSFVRPEYQRGFAPLLLLWKGIGRYVRSNPRYRVLFGPVSISNRYQMISRDLMVRFLERTAWLDELAGFVQQRNPFPKRRDAVALPRAGVDLEDLSALVSDLEPDRAGVPVLLRQYLKLGGRLLGFNIDPEFSNALDGLIVVDLDRTEPRLLERYLGKPERHDHAQ